MRIKVEDTIALVIDIQDRLVPVIHRKDDMIHNTKILIEGLKILQVQTLVTQQYTKGLGMTVDTIIESFGDGFCYDEKITFSCAEDEKILQRLEESGKKTVIICGIEAHICVLQTVIDLIDKGYRVILVEDCIGSRRESDRLVGLKRAIAEGAIPSTYESILFELMRSAKSEVFKKISQLIK